MNDSFLLRVDTRGADLGRVVEALQDLDNDRIWRVTIEEAKSERSLAQNRYLFGVAYLLISDATGYEKDDIHTALLCRHFGTKLKRVPKSKLNPQGLIEVPVRTTTTNEHGVRSVLGKIAFAEYVDFVIRFAAEHCQVVVPPPGQDYPDLQRSAA